MNPEGIRAEKKAEGAEFTPELRQKISDSFIEILKTKAAQKEELAEQEKMMREIIGVPESYIIANRNLNSFKLALYELISEPDFPKGKTAMLLRLQLEKLDTTDLKHIIDQNGHSGFLTPTSPRASIEEDLFPEADPTKLVERRLNSYIAQARSLLSTLESVFTKEVNARIRMYVYEIFITPVENALHGEKFL